MELKGFGFYEQQGLFSVFWFLCGLIGFEQPLILP
jgi:hypothetical protein